MSELDVRPCLERLFFLATQLATGLMDGLPVKWREFVVGTAAFRICVGVTRVSIQLILGPGDIGLLSTGDPLRWTGCPRGGRAGRSPGEVRVSADPGHLIRPIPAT